MKNIFTSWGNLKYCFPKNIVNVSNKTAALKNKFIAYGNGRSYGDVCLVNEGDIVLSNNFANIINFDENKQEVEVGSGLLLSQLMQFLSDKKLSLPVVPGTKYITVGGAIANDIHGKNHHNKGSFGNHVESILLLRSNGKKYLCNKIRNQKLFFATIGGLGLTGIIISAKLKLMPHISDFVLIQNLPFYSITEYLSLSRKYANSDFVVGWIDSTSKNHRGVFEVANYSNSHKRVLGNDLDLSLFTYPKIKISILSAFVVKLFNILYFNYSVLIKNKKIINFYKFHFPLDGIKKWNRMYGSKGFYQFQFSLPIHSCENHLNYILDYFRLHNQNSFLTTIKVFGKSKSPGILSFPQSEHITVAMDFKDTEKSVKCMKHIESYISANHGYIYLAKDALLSKTNFYKIYQKENIRKFLKYKDPNASSLMFERLF